MLSYHFVGVGGIGMSAIAQVLKEQGHTVSGSDRNYDNQITPQVFSRLISQGIPLYKQDGSHIHENTDFVVVSSAIEEDNPEIKKARIFHTTIIKRADLLSKMFNHKYGIAVGGTNGKTTVSCMISFILDYAGLSPTFLVGGCIKNYINERYLGNAKTGTSEIMVIEADESDGSIILYTPRISVLTNISKDHKPVEEITQMFDTFSQNTSETLIMNADCPHLKRLPVKHRNIITYGLTNDAGVHARNMVLKPFQSTFSVDNQFFEINLPGSYNVSNALAAIAVARSLNISGNIIADALRQFNGVQRRMDIIGEVDGIKVIDDYAHNPEKVKAAIQTIKSGCRRIIAIFQPHGYGPASFMKEEFIDAFIKTLSPHDFLFMPEIYYAGGTAKKTISSADIIKQIQKSGKNACFIEQRDDSIPEILRLATRDDCILVMGARDYTLPEYCAKIVHGLMNRKTPLH
uniref:UDP-N-acetylmuramate--L-alanine ligase n=1 Tax=Candidatus Loosdrechtia sp. TaxID=3101272 RepID=UPI00403ABC7B